MRNLKNIILFSLVLLFAFSSCQKDELLVDDTKKEKPVPERTASNPLVKRMTSTEIVTGETGIELGCFSIDFVFKLDVNGTVTEIASIEDFDAAIEIPIEMDTFFYINFVYPFNITYEDDTKGVISNDDELIEAFSSCIPDDGWDEPGFPAFHIDLENSCYTISYPISLTNENEDVFTVENDEAFFDLYANEDILFFVFPITLIDTDGENHVAEDDDALFNLMIECDIIDCPIDTTFMPLDGGLACYELKFPVSYTNIDGDTKTADDLDAYMNAVLNGDLVDLLYPYTVLDDEGNEIVIANENELYEAISACDDYEDFDFSLQLLFIHSQIGCYTINYPIELSDEDGSTTVNNDEELIFEVENEIGKTLVYPVSITLTETGETVSIDTYSKLEEISEECFE